ncbi:MAG: extracellular solute-binding protein [Kiritimatiellae bacterium]|nr:extracellular solute-binding protein [Kiritimatiellia bacterium]
MFRRLSIFAALAAVLGVPFALRHEGVEVLPDAVQLVVLSPHNAAIQEEYEHGFREWYRARHGRLVEIDWRNVGGTSEIIRFIDSAFDARSAAGPAGIGVDLLFGGGQYDHDRQAGKGHTVPCGVRERHPDWLGEDVIPRTASGELLRDAEDRWYGCCLSSFGICYNEDVLKTRGIAVTPRRWADLADPRFFRQIALADPTKSGSITKAFEMLIQEQMAEELRARGKEADAADETDLAAGWARALALIRRIAGNARYFTDSASKVPLDVAQGNAAAGMCIDFYGRFQSETVLRDEGSTRMQYVTPDGGSSISADPISLLRGAPHAALAREFIDFALSLDGQKLWNYRVGEPGGPVRYALRRLPVRKDMYTPAHREHMSDSQVYPYEQARAFTYRPQWTARLFGLTRALIRAMCMDPHDELVQAWRAILKAGGPDACPAAMRAFTALPPDAAYAATGETTSRMRDTLGQVRLVRDWVLFFRAHYRQAGEIAESASAVRPWRDRRGMRRAE